MRYASPPGKATRANQVSPPPPPSPRRDRKLNTRPSGDQRGPRASRVGSVNRNGSPSGRPPRSCCIQISRCRRFSSSTTVVTVKATRPPSGEMATSPTPTSA